MLLARQAAGYSHVGQGWDSGEGSEALSSDAKFKGVPKDSVIMINILKQYF